MQRKTGLGLVLLMAARALFAGISCAGDQQAKETEVLLMGNRRRVLQVAKDGMTS